ncbi:MAG TPA: DUF1573 domain-containing protein, partial [Caldithrix sp.]|nr:DUF1573 domain-containing protein [Caldithrix sp.]
MKRIDREYPKTISLIICLFGNLCIGVNSSPIKEVYIDLGEHLLGGKVDATVELLNSDSRKIVIKDIKSSCRCTIARPTSWAINPGESIEVEIEIDSSVQAGPFNADVLVVTDSELMPKVLYILSGILKANDSRLLISPKCIIAESMKPGETISQVICVRRNGNRKVGDIDIEPSSDWVRAEVDMDRSSSTKKYIKVTAKIPTDYDSRQLVNASILITGNETKDYSRVVFQTYVN